MELDVEISITREKWMQAFLSIDQGNRLSQLLSIMSGGTIRNIQWFREMIFRKMTTTEQAEYLQNELQQADIENHILISETLWQGSGLYLTDKNEIGLIVITTYALSTDFQQNELQAELKWLQQMLQLNKFPVRLLLLAFSKVPDMNVEEQFGMLETWQWEEVLETGMHMVIGQKVSIAETIILPIIAYPNWLHLSENK